MADRLAEAFVRNWLENTDAGRQQVERFGMDGALDGIFELLNAGFLKIETDGEAFVGLVPVNPPKPPATPLVRMAK